MAAQGVKLHLSDGMIRYYRDTSNLSFIFLAMPFLGLLLPRYGPREAAPARYHQHARATTAVHTMLAGVTVPASAKVPGSIVALNRDLQNCGPGG
jgi:hypothetical protein